jgi:hypothetical protein
VHYALLASTQNGTDSTMHTKHIMQISNFSIGFVSFTFWVTIIWSSVPLVYAQTTYCRYAESIAAHYLSAVASACLWDRSSCYDGDVCGDCASGAQGAVSVPCSDGCPYAWQEYTVKRIITGAYSLELRADSEGRPYNEPLFALQINHEFTAGPVQGSLEFFFRALPTTDESIAAVPEKTDQGVFHFNGQQCPSAQNYCDDTRTTSGYLIDCSAMEGGAVINFCDPNRFNKESLSVLELLWIIPFQVCSSNETMFGTMLPSSPGTTMAPSMAKSIPTISTMTTLQPVSSTTPAPSTMLGVSPVPESSTTGVPLSSTSRTPAIAGTAIPTVRPAATSNAPDTGPSFPTADEDSAPAVGPTTPESTNNNDSQAPMPSTLGTSTTPPGNLSGTIPPAVAPSARRDGASSAGQISLWLLAVLAVSSLIF